eukprot:718044-Rhodomonas_salina.3
MEADLDDCALAVLAEDHEGSARPGWGTADVRAEKCIIENARENRGQHKGVLPVGFLGAENHVSLETHHEMSAEADRRTQKAKRADGQKRKAEKVQTEPRVNLTRPSPFMSPAPPTDHPARAPLASPLMTKPRALCQRPDPVRPKGNARR